MNKVWETSCNEKKNLKGKKKDLGLRKKSEKSKA